MNLSDHREKLYLWLRQCLIGPGTTRSGIEIGDAELNGMQPLERYQTGILFPVVKGEEGLDPVDADPIAGDEDDRRSPTDNLEAAGTTPVNQPKQRYTPPSSVGFSFFIAGDEVRLQLIPQAVRYDGNARDLSTGRYQESWTRARLGDEESEVRQVLAPGSPRSTVWRQAVFGDRGELFVLWRPLGDGWLVTVSLSNTQELGQLATPRAWSEARNRLALFEVGLECVIDAGDIGLYPRVRYSLLSDEEQELELQYAHHRIYAIGHGAAVDWSVEQDRVVRIASEFLPRTAVPQVSADIDGGQSDALSIERLAAIDANSTDVFDRLDAFVSSYAAWIRDTHADAGGLIGLEQRTAGRILARMDGALTRMRDGVALLRRNKLAAQAFGLANRAMRMQMEQADRCVGRPAEVHRWRPFQLAFLLLVIESAIDEDNVHRDTLDLIWFPTGGGKTEAYLGLMAFVIAWRRLKYPATSGGTTILMRYTLRLLTKDQFRRAVRLTCALDLLRRERPELGREPVTAGIWVGQASSPNGFADAMRTVQDAAAGNRRAPSWLVLDTCPWCGDAFQAPRSYAATMEGFRFRCTNPECDYGRRETGTLPCNVVDEALYAEPPTLLIATVDKFARLAWEERASAFFGRRGNRPPELIVQDELHLIAGALGSVAGLYEAGIDTILTVRGVRPKYIASTATIRMAREQVKRLYGRKAAVFPPPGLSCDDSYFARTVPADERPGRLYVGFLAPHRGRQHCLAPLAAAVLAAPEILADAADADREALLDAWWTLLVYHSSLKGVGVSRNAVPDIERYMLRFHEEEIERRHRSDHEDLRAPDAAAHSRSRGEHLAAGIAQLSSNMTPDENAHTFERLAVPQGHPEVLDLALATNMISVGLDVSRLAAMIINGQPLTTAEYIQASSRVGRGDVPGVVVANFYRDQTRSLSHYESFRAYHESFYRFVEPTSVTPYTHQARERALHAALVIAIRHSCGRWAANDAAGLFDPTDTGIATVIDALKLRCRRADPGRAADVAAHIDALTAEWTGAAARCRNQHQRLVYQTSDSDRSQQRLLYHHDARIIGVWPTLSSMRNVENTALLKQL